MSMSQFNQWLRSAGVQKLDRGYALPCEGKVIRAAGGASDPGADHRAPLRVTISTSGRDRHGDILEPTGVELKHYLRNPVVLWAHDYQALPIGRAVGVEVGQDDIRAQIAFAETAFAGDVRRLYDEGFLRGWSVGFLPKEWDVLRDKDKKFSGYHITQWELLELSATPVPANPEALTNALDTGLVAEPALVKSLRGALSPDDTAPRSDVPGRAPRDSADGKQADDLTPEVSDPHDGQAALLSRLAPALERALRAELAERAAREIRRRQGRLD